MCSTSSPSSGSTVAHEPSRVSQSRTTLLRDTVVMYSPSGEKRIEESSLPQVLNQRLCSPDLMFQVFTEPRADVEERNVSSGENDTRSTRDKLECLARMVCLQPFPQTSHIRTTWCSSRRVHKST